MNRTPLRPLAIVLALVVLAFPGSGSADTVASLLGNFTVNQYAGLHVEKERAAIRYTVIFGQLPALRELHRADSNGDGVTSQAERDAYVEKLAPTLAQELKLTVDGEPVPLHATHWTSSLPTEQGGFSLRIDVDFEGVVQPHAASSYPIALSNQNYPGRFGWKEMVITSSPDLHLFDAEGYNNSLTADLTDAVSSLPASGPLDERNVQAMVSPGPLPAGARPLESRPGTASVPSTGAGLPDRAPAGDAGWLQKQTRRVLGLISGPQVSPKARLLALLAAALLGALHAFSPGHGKTVVGAYLIGSRGTARHAVFLGMTVTVTHTLGVFLLGFATLFASQYVVPERLFPMLSLISGLLVLLMGFWLLTQRWHAALSVLRGKGRAQASGATTPAPVAFRRMATPAYAGSRHSPAASLVMGAQTGRGEDKPRAALYVGQAFGQSHRTHSHDSMGLHSHGTGRMHSHLPPGARGEAVTWRALLALGVSGGIVPCPSAMVLLLAAVALNQTELGILLVVAFSAGLAVTITAVGFAFLYARDRIRRPLSSARWPQLLPMASAVAVTVLGVILCYGALSSAIW